LRLLPASHRKHTNAQEGILSVFSLRVLLRPWVVNQGLNLNVQMLLRFVRLRYIGSHLGGILAILWLAQGVAVGVSGIRSSYS
jgi:hypothetical protein